MGFVVSRAVGNAVVRNRVKRRLRHLCGTGSTAPRRDSSCVVRALPPAAGADLRGLASDSDRLDALARGRAGDRGS